MSTDSSPGPRSYWCFISYRHADNKEPGRQWATWLHQAIETYEVPEDLVGTVNERGDTIPERIFPVFRDEEELPVDADLSSPIYRALDASRFLLVICSPRAVASTYVGSEVRCFKQLGRGDRVLAVMIEGEPNASWDTAKQAAGFSAGQECFPETMRHKVSSDGSLLSERTEPIAADFRLGTRQGWTSSEAYRLALYREGKSRKTIEAQIQGYRKQCELMKLKVLAGILGVRLGTLTERDKAYQLALAQKRANVLRRWLVAVGLLALFAIAASALAFLQSEEAGKQRAAAVASRNEAVNEKVQAVAAQKEAENQKSRAVEAKNEADAQKAVAVSEKEHAEETLARSDFLEAEALIKEGDRNAAMAYLARSLRAEKTKNPAASLAFDLLLRQPVLRAVLEGSTDTVNYAAFSPDGCRVVSASKDDTMRVWDARTGQPLVSFGSNKRSSTENGYFQAVFSPDGSQILTSDRNFDSLASHFNNSDTSIWDAKTGTLVADLSAHDVGSYATYSPDGSKVVACLANFTRVFDAKTGAPLTPPLPNVDVESRDNYSLPNAAFSPDGKAVAVAFYKKEETMGRAQIFDTQTGRPITPPLLHDGFVFSLAFSADSSRLFTCDDKNELHVWNSKNGAQISATKSVTPLPPDSAVFSPDRTSILIAASRTAQAFNTTTGQATTIALQHAAAINYGDYSPDGTEIVTASDDGTAHVWELKAGKPSVMLRHNGAVPFATFSPDGNRILTISGKTIYIWDDVTNWLQPPATTVKVDPAAAYSANGKLVATASGDHSARIWDATTGIPVTPMLQHQGHVSSVEFSPDSTRVVTASSDNTARVWDARTGQAVTPPMVSTNVVTYATFSPDGTRVVTTSVQSRVWDAKTGEPVTPWFPLSDGNLMFSASFSPDGTRVATAGNYMAMVWDATTGQPVAGPFKHQGLIFSVKFSPDGKRLLTASEDRTARVWDIATGQPITPPIKHQDYVVRANFSPDGTLVVTASGDHSARIWDATTGLPLTLPLSHSSHVYEAAIINDNKQVRTLAMVEGPGVHNAQVWDSPQERNPTDRDSAEPGVHNVQTWDLAPNSAPPDWLSDLLEAASLTRLNDQGIIESMGVQKYVQLKQERLASTLKDPWEVFGRWYFSDPTRRTVSPWSSITVPDYVKQLINLGSEGTLDVAEKLSYGDPEVEKQIEAKRAALRKATERR